MAAELAAGMVLDKRYRLVRRLGHGGFGDVWRADELLPDGSAFREVALKLLNAEAGDASSWSEEAKLLASFRHPSLVTIYAAGIFDREGEPQRFVAMELLEGATLSEVIRARGKVAWRRVLRWACSTAQALDVIHTRGVVHLDLKPANLFLTNEGALKVLDFGISRRAGSRAPAFVPAQRGDGSPSREALLDTAMFMAEQRAAEPPPEPASVTDAFGATRPLASTDLAVPSHSGSSRLVVGTPGFMAPEIIELAEPTAGADAYALAVCVVQLTTGHLPHAAPDEPPSWDDPTAVSGWLAEIRSATVRGALKAFEASTTPLPKALVELVKQLLRVDPLQRLVVPGKLGAMFDAVWERPHGMPDPPYAGIAALVETAEGALFGRDDDIARLGRELEFESCVVLQGARASGKTSLARAGLVPYLARRAVDERDDWTSVVVRPGTDPDGALDEAFAAVSAELVSKDPPAIEAWAKSANVGLAIVVDPLEEVLGAAEERRARLGALLAHFGSGAAKPGARLIVAAREEHVPSLLELPFGEAIRPSLRFVGAPSSSAVRDVVGAPAHFSGVQVFGIDPIVADAQRELRADPSRLSFVSLALRAFWETRERDAASEAMVLRGERWTELGGVKGALARHADRVLASMSPEARAKADEILLELASGERALAPWDEAELVEAVGGDANETKATIDLLAREHLLVRRAATVTLAHEALVTSWMRLATLRLHNVHRLELLASVREATASWERADRSAELLFSGARLKEIGEEQMLEPGLGARQRAFLAASRKRHARTVAIRAAGVGLVALGLAGGAVAKRAYDEDRAYAELAARAAQHAEYVEGLANKAHKSEDPFVKAAFLVEAMRERSSDRLLPLELTSATENVPHAYFLTLDPTTGATFPWNDRWLLAQGLGGTLTVVDFKTKEPETIEDVALDADPEGDEHFRKPLVTQIRPHADPIAERAAFAFDTSFVTRSLGGEVKVFRLGDDGSVRLAAIAPMTCTGAIVTAASAPVVACPTDRGIARWDLRVKGDGAVKWRPFPGRVTDVSPDGKRVAAVEDNRVLMWSPEEDLDKEDVTVGPRLSSHGEDEAQKLVYFAAWSPRDRILAVLTGESCWYSFSSAQRCRVTVHVLDPARPSAPLFEKEVPLEGAPTSLRWDPGGLHVAVCATTNVSQASEGSWIYLRRGGHPSDERPPSSPPCRLAGDGDQAPPTLTTPSTFAEIRDRERGPHALASGWRIGKHRYLTRDLVLFDAAAPSPERLLHFVGQNELGAEDHGDASGAGVSNVVRDGDLVAWQVGDEVRTYAVSDGKLVTSRKGNLLRRCDDDRIASWTAEHGSEWIFRDARSGAELGVLPLDPGFVLGIDSKCSTVYTQRIDGVIVATSIVPDQPSRSREIARADGYVFDARTSPARGGFPAGIWLSLSSGAIARIDEGSDRVRVLGYATPRATAIGDGPKPGEVVFADETGVVVLDARGAATRVLEGSQSVSWRDVSVAPDGASMLLASSSEISVLDVARRVIAGSMPSEGKDRFTPWDDQGSALCWTFERNAGPEGLIVPRGLELARAVGAAASNLVIDGGGLGERAHGHREVLQGHLALKSR